ncbi:MAG: BamA/TamA family outer membrane protein, partial [Myxococcota bacterium]
IRQRHVWSIAYRFQHRAALNALPENAVRRALPRAGRFARVTLGYAYQNVRAFPFSISLERGPTFAVALSGLSKGLGSEYEQLLLTAQGRYYLDMPWTARFFRNHVLASRLAIGFGIGPDLAENFRLGGVAGSSALTTTTENFYGLRGFATSALGGTAVLSGSTEYRAPLFRVDRGIGTWPITFRVVHAAVFADYGRVFDKLDGRSLEGFFDEFAVGVGAEIRADILLTYGLPLTLRVGFAVPVVRPASLNSTFEEMGAYFQLGSTF